MDEREIILLVVGGVIGLTSSLLTLYASYKLDEARLRRQWEREDQLEMIAKRAEIDKILGQTSSTDYHDSDPSDKSNELETEKREEIEP